MKKVFKRISTLAAHSSAFSGFVSLLERSSSHFPNLLRVLTYHRVDLTQTRPLLYPRITVTPQAFTEQMAYLAQNYYVISMPELLDIRRSGGSLPPNSILITFDDAYRDFVEYAWPILQRYELPVTLFVPTAFPDHPEQTFWWDRLHQAFYETPRRDDIQTRCGRFSLTTAVNREHAFVQSREFVKSLPHHEAMEWVKQMCITLEMTDPEHYILSWDELHQLAREGVTLGAHTRTHPLVNRISPEEARTEAVGSWRDLGREIGHVLPIFAYPSGGINDEVVDLLQREGFELAFTTTRGINNMRTADALRLRRINVGPGTTLPILRAQLLSWLAYLD